MLETLFIKNGLIIEITEILHNFPVVYTSKTNFASIIIEGDVMSSIMESCDDIRKSIANYKAPKQILKRGKCEPSQTSEFLE